MTMGRVGLSPAMTVAGPTTAPSAIVALRLESISLLQPTLADGNAPIAVEYDTVDFNDTDASVDLANGLVTIVTGGVWLIQSFVEVGPSVPDGTVITTILNVSDADPNDFINEFSTVFVRLPLPGTAYVNPDIINTGTHLLATGDTVSVTVAMRNSGGASPNARYASLAMIKLY